MLLLILPALFALTYGGPPSYCSPYKMQGKYLNVTTGDTYHFAVDFTTNNSYSGDVERNTFVYTTGQDQTAYYFSGGSCRRLNQNYPTFARCAPPDVRPTSNGRLGINKEKLALSTFTYTDDTGEKVLDTYSVTGRDVVLISRLRAGLHYIFFNITADNVEDAYLNQDVSNCS